MWRCSLCASSSPSTSGIQCGIGWPWGMKKTNGQTKCRNAMKILRRSGLPFSPHTGHTTLYHTYHINYALPALPMLIQSQSVPVHSDTTRSEALYKPSNPLPSSSQELRLPILSCSCLDSNLGTPGKQHETSRARSGCQNTDLPHEVIISTHDHLSH